jgi:GNAT superfamily N-acetyltransferase
MDGSLEDLFVEPAHIGSGTGSALFEVAKRLTRDDGYRTLRIEADPNAAQWYRDRGAIDIGEVPSGSIPGRLLPLLELRLV